ncbi:MAG TPA: TRAP transporter substrate-binding protein, partial [Candidatus Limnocylindria bacterium]|nr:TRAP transporter substrate-binding protein [Candidatus Limnocylindria bacterium]
TASPGAPGATGPAATTAIQQQPSVTFKWQSTFGTKDFFHQELIDLAQKVNEISFGRIKVDVLVSGAVVGAFEAQDAVHKGTLDGALGVPVYWFGKDRAMSLFGTGPGMGLDANDFLAWMWFEGGEKEYDKLIQEKLKLNVKSYWFGPMPTQPFGWFKPTISGPDDLKGKKFRTVGLSIDTYQLLGMTVLALPGADIVPGIEKGVIDAAEFNNTTSDLALGFTDVAKNYYVQSYHQDHEFLELLVNKGRLEALPADLQRAIRYAVMAESADMRWKLITRNSKDYEEIEKRGVKIQKTPQSILDLQLKNWNTIVEKESKDNADFKRIYENQKAYAKRVGKWKHTINADYKLAYETTFGKL